MIDDDTDKVIIRLKLSCASRSVTVTVMMDVRRSAAAHVSAAKR